MKATLCDVCAAEGVLKTSDFRYGYKGGMRIDLCQKHKDYGKQFNKNKVEFERAAIEMIHRAQTFLFTGKLP